MIRATPHPPETSPGLVSGLCLFFLLLYSGLSFPGGIDHTVSEDDSGIWKRSNQQALYYGLIGGEIAGAVWLGGEDAVASVKVHAHWQTDVLASFALGTTTGYLAHTRDSPVILSVLPHGFMVGLRAQF